MKCKKCSNEMTEIVKNELTVNLYDDVFWCNYCGSLYTQGSFFTPKYTFAFFNMKNKKAQKEIK